MARLNEASWDRMLRAVFGIVLLYLGLAGVVSGAIGILLAVVGGVLLVTAIAGFCPLYAVLGTGTCRTTPKA
jgi:hypothetical protein